MMSLEFTPRQQKTWNRIGDIYCPAFADLPAFSETGSVENIATVLADAPQEDVELLLLLLTVLSFVPTIFLKWLVTWLDHSEKMPALLAHWLRLLRLALKGPVVSVYYGNAHGAAYQGVPIHTLIGYDVQCTPDESSPLTSDQLMSGSRKIAVNHSGEYE